jgi:RNA polymerase sigma-70 factor, ECF subfamily
MHTIDAVCYIDELFSYAIVLTRDPVEAEDLVQETYARALKALGSLRADSNVKTWLLTILRNVWLNQLRRRHAVPDTIQMDMDESSANIAVEIPKDPYALHVSKVERQQVREAIQQLSTDLREIIVLREY